MSFIPNLKTTAKAAAIAITLGTTALTAMPAQAASSPSFSFSFGIGNGDFYEDHRGRHFPRVCMTDRQVRGELRDLGYRNIKLNVGNGRHIQAKATKGRWVYLIVFNRCSGDIVDRERLHRS